jgi:hypothetical protein
VRDEWRFGVGSLNVSDGVSGTRSRQHGTDAEVQCRWRSARALALWSSQRLILGVVNASLIGDNSKNLYWSSKTPNKKV